MTGVAIADDTLTYRHGDITFSLGLLDPRQGRPPRYAPELPGADPDLGMSPFVLHEWTAYAAAIMPPDPEVRVWCGDQEARPLRGQQYLVQFSNRIGRSEIRCERRGQPLLPPLAVEVVSPKLSLDPQDSLYYPAFYRRLVAGVVQLLPTLPYAFSGPTALSSRIGPLPAAGLFHYHFLLRHRADLAGALAAIGREPHRVLAREEAVLPLAGARRLDHRAARWLAGHPGAWEQVPPDSGLPAVCRSGPGTALAPARVLQERAEETFDTPENQFVRYFAGALAAAARTVRSLAARLGLPADGLDQVQRELEQALARPWLQEAGPLHLVPTGSHVLQRRDGYRDMYRLYPAFLFARTPFAGALGEAVQNRDVATLYECWCFLALAQALARQLGPPDRVQESGDAAGGMRPGLTLHFPGGAALGYNRHFSRGQGSYSVGLRPDFTVRLPGGDAVCLDAKFRLSLPPGELDDDDGERAPVLADLYKMHTYRDALGHRAAVTLYPGNRQVFYRAPDGGLLAPGLAAILTDRSLAGVGALPFAPPGPDQEEQP